MDGHTLVLRGPNYRLAFVERTPSYVEAWLTPSLALRSEFGLPRRLRVCLTATVSGHLLGGAVSFPDRPELMAPLARRNLDIDLFDDLRGLRLPEPGRHSLGG